MPQKNKIFLFVGGLVLFGLYKANVATNRTSGILDAATTGAQLLKAELMQTPAVNMALSQAGLDLIAAREGFSPHSYPDANGRSIGYGHFIKTGESFTEPMSVETASALLSQDTDIAQNAVRGYVTVPITQNQFDALVSFVYNVGVGAFKSSTLLNRLNQSDYAGAAAQFDMWHKPATVISRRDGEKAQFLA